MPKDAPKLKVKATKGYGGNWSRRNWVNRVTKTYGFYQILRKRLIDEVDRRWRLDVCRYSRED